MNFSTEKTIIDLENRLVVTKGEREGVVWIRSLGLIDAIYSSWNEFTMRSCCGALRIMSIYVHHNTTMGGNSMYIYMCIYIQIQIQICLTWSPCSTAGKKEEDVVYIHNGILLSHQKNKIMNTMINQQTPQAFGSQTTLDAALTLLSILVNIPSFPLAVD